MSANGYKEAGYEYIVVDDCWSELDRDAETQKLIPDLKRFPSGLKHLSDYVRKTLVGLKSRLLTIFERSDPLAWSKVWPVPGLRHENVRWLSGHHRLRGAGRAIVCRLGR